MRPAHNMPTANTTTNGVALSPAETIRNTSGLLNGDVGDYAWMPPPPLDPARSRVLAVRREAIEFFRCECRDATNLPLAASIPAHLRPALAKLLIDNADPHDAPEVARNLTRLAVRLADEIVATRELVLPAFRAMAWKAYAVSLAKCDECDDALAALTRAEGILGVNDTFARELGILKYARAFTLRWFERIQEALAAAASAREIFAACGDSTRVQMCTLFEATCAVALGESHRPLRMCRDFLRRSTRDTPPHILLSVYTIAAKACADLGHTDDAMDYLDCAEALCLQLGARVDLAGLDIIRGQAAKRRLRYADALEYFERAEAQMTRLGVPAAVVKAGLEAVDVLVQAGELMRARSKCISLAAEAVRLNLPMSTALALEYLRDASRLSHEVIEYVREFVTNPTTPFAPPEFKTLDFATN